MFSKSSFSVLRRYSDFLWLYETLSQNNPGVVVPPTPEKNAFGRFGDQFVQQRRLALEKCIQKIANHPVLCKDQDLKFFLESDTFALDVCDCLTLFLSRRLFLLDQAQESRDRT
jgi:sorting nexin-1/2